MEERYVRQFPLISPAQQALLAEKRVCIIGCGGLGGYLIEYLARLGVGYLTVVDGDKFDATNLNRQLLATEDLLGHSKAEEAARRISRVNSAVSVRPVGEFFTEANGRGILQGHDLAMDALDQVHARRLLGRLCEELGIPAVHGAIQGWNAQVSVCMPGSGRMEQLFPKDFLPASRASLPFTPPYCAAIQCAEALKLLCGETPSLAGHVLLSDLRDMRTTLIPL